MSHSKLPSKAPAPTPAPAAPAAAAGGGDLLGPLGSCRALLDKLLRHKDACVFSKPVDARGLGLRDYYTVIRKPMDLGTVLRRLERRRYADPHEFAADVLLTFRNAISYYNKGDPVYETAVEILEIFETGWTPILASLPPPPPPTDAERKERLRDDLPRMPMDVATLDELDQMGRRGRPDDR